MGTYVPGGHLFYAEGDRRFLTVPFDLDTLSVTGLPTGIPFLDDVVGNIAVGADGTLASFRLPYYEPGLGTLTWVNRDGTEEALVLDPDRFRVPRISPEGGRQRERQMGYRPPAPEAVRPVGIGGLNMRPALS